MHTNYGWRTALEGTRPSGRTSDVGGLFALTASAFWVFGPWASITFGSGGGLLAAPLVGGVAEVTGLRTALGLVVVAGLAVSVLSTRLRGKKAGRSG